ncbi:MAG: hypothetical protein N2112_06500 [Gemmataceae bacterium]|jgi:hypothetical protein|nr:hypothetical protein [Gemmataceae bacterium]
MLSKKIADKIFDMSFLPSGRLVGIVRRGQRVAFLYWSLPHFEEQLIYQTPDLELLTWNHHLSIASQSSTDLVAGLFQSPDYAFRFVVRGTEAIWYQGANWPRDSRLFLSPDGQRMIAQVGSPVTFYMGSPEEGYHRVYQTEGVRPNRQLRCYGFLSDGEHYLAWGRQRVSLEIHRFPVIFPLRELPLDIRRMSTPVWNPNRDAILIRGNQLLFVDLRDWQHSLRMEPLFAEDRPIRPRRFALHPNQDRILCYKEGTDTIEVYSRKAQAMVEGFAWGKEDYIALGYSHDGLMAFAATQYGEVVVWDVE